MNVSDAFDREGICSLSPNLIELSLLFLLPLIPPLQDAETVMSQAVSPSTVTPSLEPAPAPAPRSSHAPVALTSAMPITAACLLQAAKGFLAPRSQRLLQVVAFPMVLEPTGGRRIGQDENQGQFSPHPRPNFLSSWPWKVGCPGDWEIRGLVTSMGVVWKAISLKRGEVQCSPTCLPSLLSRWAHLDGMAAAGDVSCAPAEQHHLGY